MKEYNQVVEPYQHEIIIKKSRFITTLVPVTSQADADMKVQEISKRYNDANHNCYSYISNIIATEQRFSDNGEPQGTAGIPMLEVLKKRNIVMTLAVVTRYFGGVKLGVGGLVRAYSDSVVEALASADVRRFVMSDVASFNISYSQFPRAIEIIEKASGRVISIDYSDGVTIKYVAPCDINASIIAKIFDYSSGKVDIKVSEKDYIDYKLV